MPASWTSAGPACMALARAVRRRGGRGSPLVPRLLVACSARPGAARLCLHLLHRVLNERRGRPLPRICASTGTAARRKLLRLLPGCRRWWWRCSPLPFLVAASNPEYLTFTVRGWASPCWYGWPRGRRKPSPTASWRASAPIRPIAARPAASGCGASRGIRTTSSNGCTGSAYVLPRRGRALALAEPAGPGGDVGLPVPRQRHSLTEAQSLRSRGEDYRRVPARHQRLHSAGRQH